MIADNDWINFARKTVLVHDLDPMYDFLWAAKQELGDEWAYKFALHFFMFYHVGGAVKAASHRGDFWQHVRENYDICKRGTERRHFRGDKGKIAVETLSQMGSPEQIWNLMWRPTYYELYSNLSANFQGAQIGPYFAWKAMDLLDRGLGMPVELDITAACMRMPDEPRQCALTVWPNRLLQDSLVAVANAIGDLDAPGAPDKKCGYAEAETVLCMIKGYFLTKTHTLGDDVVEKHEQLAEFPELLHLLPPILDWSQYAV